MFPRSFKPVNAPASAPFLIVETGRPVPSMQRYGRFPHWIRVAAGLEAADTDVVEAAAGQALPDPAAYAGVLVTGSAAFVTDREDWSERSAHWLRGAVQAGGGASILRRRSRTASLRLRVR